tara:strand:- start:155 stop:640 length:486 start_codon:yes stop_codon:yes gene_type:complete
MKKIATLLLTLLMSMGAWAEKNEMISLKDFMEDRADNVSNPDALYVSYRCLSYYYNLSGILSLGGEREKELNEKLEQTKVDFIEFGWLFWRLIEAEAEREADYDTYTENLTNSIMKMTRSYQIETNNSWNNTGSYFNDYINTEGNTCQLVHQAFTQMMPDK